uniref:Uncharacterized protein n=1 Tax=Meloidogyne enterolobii TaxID=390850 RepID=A0A6V7U9S8_MELEN|nr:unnamed protein product [Meloidogyne enterolobii]
MYLSIIQCNKSKMFKNIILASFSLLILAIIIQNNQVNSLTIPDKQLKWVFKPVPADISILSNDEIIIPQRRTHNPNKRMAEVGKRERIILDSLGGNDFLIKRSGV